MLGEHGASLGIIARKERLSSHLTPPCCGGCCWLAHLAAGWKSPAEPGSGLLGACWLCAHHSTSTRGLSSPVNPRCSCTSTLLPSWDAPGQHGCPICAPRAPAALLQLPHPPGGACVGLCPSEPVLKPEPLKVRGSSVIIHLWPPHSSQPGPCATAHSEKRCFSSRRRWP